jgi:polar amino acid transport system substrate-binding protein
MNRRILGTASLAALAAMPMIGARTAAAEQLPTFQRILKEKRIRMAVEFDSPPFGVLDANGKPDGLEIAANRRLAKDLGVAADFVQVTGPARIPALLSGRADVIIASLSITLARAETVAFASPHGALTIVITAPAGTKIKSAADLAGKRVGLTRGTLEEATVPPIAPKGTKIVFFDDISATIQALLNGQLDAAGMSGFAAKSIADRNPNAHLENKFTVTTAYYAAAVRPGDWESLQWINTWVFIHKQDGVFAAIYKHYTGLDLPPLPTL